MADLDPRLCPADPLRKGWKLCPHCGASLVPAALSNGHAGSASARDEITRRMKKGEFPRPEDYKNYRWVCTDGCEGSKRSGI